MNKKILQLKDAVALLAEIARGNCHDSPEEVLENKIRPAMNNGEKLSDFCNASFIDDFCLFHWGQDMPEYADRLSEIYDNLKNHYPILISFKDEIICGIPTLPYLELPLKDNLYFSVLHYFDITKKLKSRHNKIALPVEFFEKNNYELIRGTRNISEYLRLKGYSSEKIIEHLRGNTFVESGSTFKPA